MSIRLLDKLAFRGVGTARVATMLHVQPLTNKVSVLRLCSERYYKVVVVVMVRFSVPNSHAYIVGDGRELSVDNSHIFVAPQTNKTWH